MSGNRYELDKNQMGERIRVLREGRQFSREDLAENLGISSRHLADIETGSRGMSIELLYRLTKALQTSADYILDGHQDLDEDARRLQITNSINHYLSFCSTDALEHMEDITKSYVISHTDIENGKK